MFPIAYFCARLFAPRFFPEAGATSLFNPAWLVTLNQQVGPTPLQPSPQ
jgi:hypothetical protein